MLPVRIKICGITRQEDALAAVAAGADAVGFVFYPGSPRAISIERAADIMQSLPPFVTTVGLVVDMPRRELEALLGKLPLDLLQFHGNETAEECSVYGRPYIKAIRVGSGESVTEAMQSFPSARGILLDTYVKGVPGGTGKAFDWSLVPRHAGVPIVLAGGLTPDNVAEAVFRVRPYAVDVSGGVEIQAGVKDVAKLQAFIRAVRSACSRM